MHTYLKLTYTVLYVSYITIKLEKIKCKVKKKKRTKLEQNTWGLEVGRGEHLQKVWHTHNEKTRRKRGEKEAGDVFEVVVADSFAKFMKDTRSQIQEAQKIPKRINTKKSTPKHITVKLQETKDKKKCWKKPKVNNNNNRNTCRGTSVTITLDLSSETMQAGREWSEIFKMLKEKTHQPRILYPAKLSFKSEGEIKSFLDREKLKEFVASRSTLQKI